MLNCIYIKYISRVSGTNHGTMSHLTIPVSFLQSSENSSFQPVLCCNRLTAPSQENWIICHTQFSTAIDRADACV